MTTAYMYSPKANPPNGGAPNPVWPAGSLVQTDEISADWWVAHQGANRADKLVLDMPAGIVGGTDTVSNHTVGILLTFTGSTPITIDLTDLVSATGVDVVVPLYWGSDAGGQFSLWGSMIFSCPAGSAGAVEVAPGASNGARTPLSGSAVGVTLSPGDVHHWRAAAGLVVDSTHKTLTFTPTSGGTLLLAICGT